MRCLALLLVLASAAWAQSPSPSPTPEAAVSARSRALDLAGAFANDGYKVRDGSWTGAIQKDRPLLLEVNLFAGNEYWFSAASASPAAKLVLSVFDEQGRLLDGETFSDAGTAAAGIVPAVSGPVIVRLALAEGDRSEACLLYSYK